MGELKASTESINQAVGSLKNAYMILDVELNTLKEVVDVVETAWISESTDTLVSCINKTRKNIDSTSDYLKGSVAKLNNIAWLIKANEATNIVSNFLGGE